MKILIFIFDFYEKSGRFVLLSGRTGDMIDFQESPGEPGRLNVYAYTMEIIKDDLDKLVKWSEKWQMLFNFGKCICIHIGHGNMDEDHTMGDAILDRTTKEKDLGVTFSVNMKVSEQCGIAASKGNTILGLIKRTITYKEKWLVVPLYKEIA